MDAQPPAPLFRAMATSTRPIYQLLRCVSFSNKVHVEISEDGIKFIADHARVMQGMASLSKSMFATFNLNLPSTSGQRGGDDEDDEDEDEEDDVLPASFQISLPALLEALQIFGVTDAPTRQIKPDPDTFHHRSNMRNYNKQAADAFSHQILGMPGTCSLSYVEEGAPFGIILEESSVKTTCNLATYVPESLEAIPFDREDLLFKMIMQPRWLLGALVELAPSSPNLLTIVVTRGEPYLRLSSHGPLGSSSVDFSRGRSLFESIWVGERWSQSFKFDMIKSATEAMRIASKVSIRGDRQGVLSLQFMVEMEHSSGGGSGGFGGGGGGGSISSSNHPGASGTGLGGTAGPGGGSGSSGMQWLHFTFVPYITDEEEDDEEDGGGNDGGEAGQHEDDEL